MRVTKLMAAALIMACVASDPIHAATFMIGDDDGYGIGIDNNGKHPFDGKFANYDGRSDAEKVAADGAQFTDTYSTTQPGFSPQTGTIAKFIFTGLGNSWTQASLEFDMADFQAIDEFGGAVAVNFNGIAQNWAFTDGFPNTVIRAFNLDQAVLDSINSKGELVITIDRKSIGDFYGFDYAKLTGTNTVNAVPVPAALWLFGSALLGLGPFARRRRSV